MHPVFQESVHFPTRHYCCGLRLYPLTIGHLFLLRDIRSPFVIPGEEFELHDLMAAVLVCAQPYPQSRKMVHGRNWLRTFWFRVLALLLGLANRKSGVASQFEAFQNYLSHHRRFPDVTPPQGETRSLHAPFEWRLVRSLMRQEQFGFEQSLNLELLRAVSFLCTDEERAGNLELLPYSDNRESIVKSLWDWAREQDQKWCNN